MHGKISCLKQCFHRNKVLRITVYSFFLFLILHFVVIFIKGNKRDEYNNCLAEKQINCGNYELGSAVLPLVESATHRGSILFVEGLHNDRLYPRMLCAIESAAVAHPNNSIDVLMTTLKLKLTPTVKSLLETYQNVRFFYLNATKLYIESPLKIWYLEETWKKTSWPGINYNYPLRWLLLWKYGGIYLDMDVIIFQNLLNEKNFAGLETKYLVGASILSFTKKHPFVKACIRKMASNFKGNVWEANAPKLLTSTLIERCGLELPTGNLRNCSDMKIYKSKVFYSIPWREWSKYFEDNKGLSNELLTDSEILGIHVWNFLSHSYPANLQESSPYASAAKRFCPKIVAEVGNKF